MITVSGPAPGTLLPPSRVTLPGGEGAIPEIPFAQQSRLDRLKLSGKYDTTDEIDRDEDEDERGEREIGDNDVQENEQGKRMESSVKKKMRGKDKSTKRYVTSFFLHQKRAQLTNTWLQLP